jgi:lipid-A-disaccharide synthase
MGFLFRAEPERQTRDHDLRPGREEVTGPILIVAGEKSGENYGAAVVRRFLEIRPEARFFGIGGSRMASEGVELLYPMSDLAVIGVFEILSELPRIRRIFRGLQDQVRRRKPAAAVLIDSPDFNLRLAKRLHRLGVPVLYYIGPTVWAWRRGRLKTIERHVRTMCLIFPFEEQIYRDAGVAARFVGHPLLERVKVERDRATFFQAHRLDENRPLIALLPGSRKSEIAFHMPILVRAAARLVAEGPRQFVLPLAEDLGPGAVEPYLESTGLDIRIVSRDTYGAMAHSDLVLSSCGTANLETALLGTPLVAFYKLSALTYFAGRPFVGVPHYSIVNILAGERIVPELVQKEFTAGNLVREARRILGSAEIRETMRARFDGIRGSLGDGSASLGVARELDRIVSSL